MSTYERTVRRYVGNAAYNIYNKKACNLIHAHWTVSFGQLIVGVVWSLCLWGSGLRKAPKISGKDWMSLVPIGLFASAAHGGSVLASGAGAVSFAQIVKACEPVYVAVLCLIVPPIEIKPALAYAMLLVIVGGVGFACVKEGKGVEITDMQERVKPILDKMQNGTGNYYINNLQVKDANNVIHQWNFTGSAPTKTVP